MVVNVSENRSPPLLVALTGLPSAGKSTMLNVLAGKLLHQTGMSRTTTDVKLVGRDNRFSFPEDRFRMCELLSDDGIMFDILDLPGVSDASDANRQFDEATHAWITKADLIFWLSDARTAFNTRHEKEEFERIRSELVKTSQETGTAYGLGIVLTKFNEPPVPTRDVVVVDDDFKQRTRGVVPTSADEIGFIDPDLCQQEETGYSEALSRVRNMFSDDKNGLPVQIFTFNAHGRVLHGETRVSESLLQRIRSVDPGAFGTHTELKLAVFSDNWSQLQLSSLFTSLQFHCEKYRQNARQSHNLDIKSTLMEQLMLIPGSRPYLMQVFQWILTLRSTPSNYNFRYDEECLTTYIQKAVPQGVLFDVAFSNGFDLPQISGSSYHCIGDFLLRRLGHVLSVLPLTEDTEKILTGPTGVITILRICLLGGNTYSRDGVLNFLKGVAPEGFASEISFQYILNVVSGEYKITPAVFENLAYVASTPQRYPLDLARIWYRNNFASSNPALKPPPFESLSSQLRSQPLLAANKQFVEEVSKYRRQLWSSAEDNVDVAVVVRCFLDKQSSISSLFGELSTTFITIQCEF